MKRSSPGFAKAGSEVRSVGKKCSAFQKWKSAGCRVPGVPFASPCTLSMCFLRWPSDGAIGLTEDLLQYMRRGMQCNTLWHSLDISSIETDSIVVWIKSQLQGTKTMTDDKNCVDFQDRGRSSPCPDGCWPAPRLMCPTIVFLTIVWQCASQ